MDPSASRSEQRRRTQTEQHAMTPLLSCKQLLRGASGVGGGGAAAGHASASASLTARAVLSAAGFDTPSAPSAAPLNAAASVAVVAAKVKPLQAVAAASAQAKPPAAQAQQQAAQPCPLATLSGSSSPAATMSLLPSLFASANRCPCGMYASANTPASCAWAAANKKQAATTATSTPAIERINAPSAMMGVSRSTIAAKTTLQMQMQRVTSGPGLMQARAFSAAATAAVVASAATGNKNPSASASAEIHTSASAGAAAPSSSSPSSSSSEPLSPPAISLSPSISAAHSGLLAIEEYRSGVQGLFRSPPGSSSLPPLGPARESLGRTLDIVAYIPHQPFWSLHVKALLAFVHMKQGNYRAELVARMEVLRELEKMWVASSSPKSSSGGASTSGGAAAAAGAGLKGGPDAFVMNQALNALALAFLRINMYEEARTLCDTWLPRFEALLFEGPAPAAAAAAAASAGATTTHHHHHHHHLPTPPSSFSTGASRSKILAEYLVLVQVALVSHTLALAAAGAAAGNKQAQATQVLEGRLAALASQMISSSKSSRNAGLQASAEWKLFQGELLMLPQAVHDAVKNLGDLLPPLPPPTTTAGTATPAASKLERAVAYFQNEHPELARLPLSDTNLRRQWYSPLVHAFLLSSEAEVDRADAAMAAKASGGAGAPAAAASPSSSLEMLSSSLSFIESSLSSDSSSPYMLRTLSALAVASYRLRDVGDAIQAEGLFRSVTSRLEVLLGAGGGGGGTGAGVQASLDASKFTLYVSVLLEYVFLLTKLEWNKRSRAPEARALFLDKFIRPLQRDPRARDILAQLISGQELKRNLGPRIEQAISAAAAGPGPARDLEPLQSIRTAEDITDDMLELPLRSSSAVAASPSSSALPEWLVDKLQVGSGVTGR